MSDLKSRVLLALLGLSVLIGGPYLFAYIHQIAGPWSGWPSFCGALVAGIVGATLTLEATSRH